MKFGIIAKHRGVWSVSWLSAWLGRRVPIATNRLSACGVHLSA